MSKNRLLGNPCFKTIPTPDLKQLFSLAKKIGDKYLKGYLIYHFASTCSKDPCVKLYHHQVIDKYCEWYIIADWWTQSICERLVHCLWKTQRFCYSLVVLVSYHKQAARKWFSIRKGSGATFAFSFCWKIFLLSAWYKYKLGFQDWITTSF